MALLNREAIFNVSDIKTQDIEVPEWGGSVRVRQMTVAEVNSFSARVKDTPEANIGCWLVASLCVDEKGNPLFQAEDVEKLEKKNFRPVANLAQAIMKVNGLGAEAVKAAEKNS